MTRTFDLAVVGAGPAGLMTAKKAAQKGLSVVLIEKKKDICAVTRPCCQQLIMDEDYMGETLRVDPDKIVFTKNGFHVHYSGPRLEVKHKYFVSPSGHSVHFAHADRRAIVIKIDKRELLQGLLEDCLHLGVVVKSASRVTAMTDEGARVSIALRNGHSRNPLACRKAVVTEGVNARLTEKLGFNAGRTLYASALCTLSVLEGVQDGQADTMESFMGQAYRSFAPVIMCPDLGGSARRCLVIIGNPKNKPEKIFKEFTTQSPLAPMFAEAQVVKKTACMVRAYSPLPVPFSGNILVVGDAAAYVEVEIQGALACGFRAGSAVAHELEGRAGFADYSRWWQGSFEFHSNDFMQVAQGFALVPTYTDSELDYLFKLIEGETLPGTYNQYNSPRLMWNAILNHRNRIARERPELHEKIEHNSGLTLKNLFEKQPQATKSDGQTGTP